MITVVIPYFQRQSGVLRRALASIAAQTQCPLPLTVIVVDDASPVPADDEIAAVALPAAMKLQLIRQANGGPGAARNTGLDAVDAQTRYVAFLDSDDEWSADHLARAASALDQGHDFYFADHFQLGQTVAAFARAGRIQPTEHPTLPGPWPQLHAYQGDMFNQILTGNVIGTSTVLYRVEPFRQSRFRIELKTAGEDYVFWMGLAVGGARIAFSAQVEATYGRGVNVYSGAVWGTEAHLRRVVDELRFRHVITQLFGLSSPQLMKVNDSLRHLRRDFAGSLLHVLASRKLPPPGLLFDAVRADPATLLAIPALVFDKLKGKK